MRLTLTMPLIAGTLLFFATVAEAQNQPGSQPAIELSTLNFDSLTLEPAALAAFPYCTGERPSTIIVHYKASAGTVFGPENVFQLEVSDVLGNFDNTRYPARFVGSTKSTASRGDLINVRLPDNLPFNPTPAAGQPNRYKVRIVSTDPATVSAPSAEISSWNLCPSRLPKMYSSTLRPLQRRYIEGQSVSMTVFKDPTLVPIAGDILRIQLSDTNGIFRGLGVVTTQLDSVPAAFVGDSMVVSFRFPAIQLPNSIRYRVRPVLASQPAATSTSTGHDIRLDTVVASRVNINPMLAVYPNPAQDFLSWKMPNPNETVKKAILTSLAGQTYEVDSNKSGISVAHIPAGIYQLTLKTQSSIYWSRVVIMR